MGKTVSNESLVARLLSIPVPPERWGDNKQFVDITFVCEKKSRNLPPLRVREAYTEPEMSGDQVYVMYTIGEMGTVFTETIQTFDAIVSSGDYVDSRSEVKSNG